MATPVRAVVNIVGQVVGYAAFCSAIAYFATAPTYRHLPPDAALVKVSLQHAGQRKEACRERGAEELARLAPNMRVASVCPRERVPLAVVVQLDGTTVVDTKVRPSGLARDGAGTLYWRVEVPAGRHRVVAKLGDTPAPGFTHVREADVELAPGAILLIDFDAQAGGWRFRS